MVESGSTFNHVVSGRSGWISFLPVAAQPSIESWEPRWSIANHVPRACAPREPAKPASLNQSHCGSYRELNLKSCFRSLPESHFRGTGFLSHRIASVSIWIGLSALRRTIIAKFIQRTRKAGRQQINDLVPTLSFINEVFPLPPASRLGMNLRLSWNSRLRCNVCRSVFSNRTLKPPVLAVKSDAKPAIDPIGARLYWRVLKVKGRTENLNRYA